MHQPFRKASVYIGLMLILEVLTGLGIIIVTAVYQFFLSSYLDDIECRLVMSYCVNVYIFGVQLIVTFICSISLWNRLWKRRCTPNIRLMIALWLFYSCIIIASGFGATWNIYYSMDVLENAAETSLLRGIDDYYSSPDWKLLWDGLQIRKQCCGVNSYRDWMEAEWMPRQTRAGQKCGKSVLAPIACTKRGAEPDIPNYMLMGEDFSQKNAKRPMFPKLTIDMINTNGCLPIFMKDLWRYFYILLFLVLLALKFLICLCCFTKYILQRQNTGEECENAGFTDDEGRPLVMVKYPRSVRCVIIGEDDMASDMAPDAAYCNCEEGGDTYECCKG